METSAVGSQWHARSGRIPTKSQCPGRRVIVGWHVNDNGANAVSLTRELVRSDDPSSAAAAACARV